MTGSGVRFCVRLPHSWCAADPRAIARVAAEAERLGFWGVSVQDHFIQDAGVAPCGKDGAHGEDRNAMDALQVLAYVAARTERVRLVTGVIVLPMRNPFSLAKEVATLDVLSSGRVVFGVGVGAPPQGGTSSEGQHLGGHSSIASKEFEVFGVSGNRGKHADEAIRVLDALWTQERAAYRGKRFTFDEVEVYPKPVQTPRPPIWIGGRSPEAQRRAALLAEGWIPSQCPLPIFEEGVRSIRRLAAERGRRPPEDFGINVFISVATTERAAQDDLRRALGRRFQGDAALFAATIAATPVQAIAHIERYRRAGLNVIDLKFLPLALEPTLEQMRLLASEVMPALAAA
ncbi:MAG: LLM class flavin-dependent oxidoreductase [Chloroflexi bacterium]|nr:LLM class flavin-dependent oxidoreductase [Chloroflexota bacterium]